MQPLYTTLGLDETVETGNSDPIHMVRKTTILKCAQFVMLSRQFILRKCGPPHQINHRNHMIKIKDKKERKTDIVFFFLIVRMCIENPK